MGGNFRKTDKNEIIIYHSKNMKPLNYNQFRHYPTCYSFCSYQVIYLYSDIPLRFIKISGPLWKYNYTSDFS